MYIQKPIQTQLIKPKNVTSGTLNKLLQPTVFKGFLIFVILFGTLMMGCDKEEPCSCDELFVEPAWVKEIQTEIENDPFICSADLVLYELLDDYFIDKRVLVDTTWNEIGRASWRERV